MDNSWLEDSAARASLDIPGSECNKPQYNINRGKGRENVGTTII